MAYQGWLLRNGSTTVGAVVSEKEHTIILIKKRQKLPDSRHADETACATIFRVGFTFFKKVSKLPPLKSHQTGLRLGKRELLSTPSYLTRHNIVKRQTPIVYHTATICQVFSLPVRLVCVPRPLYFFNKVGKLPPLKSHQTGLRLGKRE